MRYRKIILHGSSGVGKTTFLGSAGEDARSTPFLVLDFEGGGMALEGSKVQVERVASFDQFQAIYEELLKPDPQETPEYYIGRVLRDKTRPQPAGCIYKGTKYRALAIDSLSEVHTASLLNVSDSRAKAAGDNTSRNDPNMLQQDDYGKSLSQMRRLIRAFRDLPMHWFATALSKTEIEPREGLVKKPAFSGQLADESIASFDVCGCLMILDAPRKKLGKPKEEKKEDEEFVPGTRILVLQNTPGIRAKIRTPWGKTAPDSMMNPTVTELFNILEVSMPEKEEAMR
jgi:hypothetical protein